MTEHESSSSDSPELELPQALRDDLAGLYGRPGPVPPEREEAILAYAESQLVRQHRSSMVRRFSRIGAVAAAAAIGVMIWLGRRDDTPRIEQAPMASRETVAPPRHDIDHSGRVDILDAFRLARHVERADALGTEYDFNGDGLIDDRDVDAVAMAAVSLKGGAS